MSEPTANVIGDLRYRPAEELTGEELLELQVGEGMDSSQHTDLDAVAGFAIDQVQVGSGMRKVKVDGITTVESGGADVVVITTSTTLGPEHLNRTLLVISVSPVTLTIPVGLLASAQIEGFQGGTGAVSVVAGAGVNLRRNNKLAVATDGQWAPFGIKRIGLNEWVYFGQLVSA